MTLQVWAWIFFALYSACMLGLGYWGSRRVAQAEDYAVARGSYGPITLALAFAATNASGATFLGLPGLAYSHGVSILIYAFAYPIGVYIGVHMLTSGLRFWQSVRQSVDSRIPWRPI